MRNRRRLHDRAAEPESYEARAPDLQAVEKSDQVLDQRFDAVARRRGLRAALSAQVVAQHAKVPLHRGHMPIPHGKVVCDARDERHPRQLVAAIEAELDLYAVHYFDSAAHILDAE